LAGTPAEKGIETFALFAAVRSGNEQKTLDWLRRAAEAGSLNDMMRAESDGVMQSFSLLSRSSLKAEHIQL
jgi:Cdc6-like AAA superfamily ATPase